MMSVPEMMISWLLKARGKKLLSVTALFHSFDSGRDTFPQQIGLLFEGAEVVRIYGGSDGSSILFSLSELVGCDLGEYGRQDVFCVSGEPCYSSVVGRTLSSASFVESSLEGTVIGVVFFFESGMCLSVLNLGDELFVYNEIPMEVVVGEGLSLVLVS